MLKLHLLSRAREFSAMCGITDDKKDYLSIIKNQGNEGLCWAYSLTSAIEMKYALQSGNRLMLDPRTLSNNSVNWFKKHGKNLKEDFSFCYSYGEFGGYPPACALMFMMGSRKSMMQMDGNNSHVFIENADSVENIANNTVDSLCEIMNKYELLYSGIEATEIFQVSEVVDEYYIDNETTNHGIVITSIGKLSGRDGIYAEILNSWGYEIHYDGLAYVKIADNETDIIHNNLHLFDYNYWIHVDRFDETYGIVILLLILFIILTLGLLIALICLVCVFCCHCQRFHCLCNKKIDDGINSIDIEQSNKESLEVGLNDTQALEV